MQTHRHFLVSMTQKTLDRSVTSNSSPLNINAGTEVAFQCYTCFPAQFKTLEKDLSIRKQLELKINLFPFTKAPVRRVNYLNHSLINTIRPKLKKVF